MASDPGGPREKIVAAATQQFLERGYSGTTMAELASRAGTSVGLLYYHFGSKEDLYLAIWNDYQLDQESRVSKAVVAARAAGIGDPVELLQVSTRAYMEGAWRHREKYWMVHASDIPQKLVDARRDSGERWRQRNAAVLASDTPILSRVVTATVLGFLTEVSLEVVKSADETEAQAVIEDAMSLLGAMLNTFVEVRNAAASSR